MTSYRPLFILFLVLSILLTGGCHRDHSKKVQGYIEGRFTYLASSLSGDLEKRFVIRGQRVKVGDPIFILDQEPEAAELKQAQKNLIAETEKLADLTKGSRQTILNSIKAEIAQAKSDLALAKITLKRRSSLVKSGAISKASYDRALTDFQVKQKRVKKLEADLAEAELGSRVNVISEQAARVEASKANIEKLQWEISQKNMKSPIDAVVFDTFFREGEFVPTGQAVVALLSPKRVYLIFYIPEPLLSSIKVGQQVYFNCDGCKEKQSAKIYFIAPNAEYTPPVIFSKESRHKLVFRVEAKMPLEKVMRFHPGQPVDVTLTGNGNAK